MPKQKEYVVGTFLYILLCFHVVSSEVTWVLSTREIKFGQDIVLTCYIRNPARNSKDCSERQWLGGPGGHGLMKNGYPSDEEKYEELANLSTNQFSLRIKNVLESDVNVDYSCSCGFDIFTQKLELDNTNMYLTWNMTTYPAIFGRDVMLTCYTFLPLNNSKDCSVRQWSGGTDDRGLMYNGFSSNEEKYEEKVNLLSNQFSLIIKNFSITDINVNYTCSCGFFASTHQLQLDEKRFQCLPDSANASITSYNDTLKIKMLIRKVYPLPNCTVYVGNRVVSKQVRLTHRKSGLFYSVNFETEYNLMNEDCNEKPRIQCDLLKEQITFEGNKTNSCTDYTTEPSCNQNTSLTEDDVKKRSSSHHRISVILAASICTLLIAPAVLSIFARKRIKKIMELMCHSSKDIGNSTTTIEHVKCIQKPCTGTENHETHLLII